MADRAISIDTAEEPGSQFPAVVNAEITHLVGDQVQPLVEAAVPPLVTDAIANDPDFADAADAAVNAAIAGRDLVEAVEHFPLTAVGGFIGENGRGTDLLFDANGEVLDETIDRWKPRLDVPDTADSVQYGTGFVGADGVTATELITDLDGKVPARVLIAQRDRTPAAPDPAVIVLPSTIYMVAGQTYRLEYAKCIANYNRNTDVIVTGPALQSGNFGTYWQYTPAGVETFTLVVLVKDRLGATVASKSASVVVQTAASATSLRLLPIGDSITRAGQYAYQAAETILGGQTVGTRTENATVLCKEGRNGWRLDYYVNTNIGMPTDGDSPFLFPVGTTAAHYLGNTSFWKSVVTGDTTFPNYAGFELMAKGWNGAGAYLYSSSTGYPLSPVSGDVIVDPLQSVGSKWRQWNGSSWATMSPQPAVALDFSKYMDRYGAAFATLGVPTAISVMLSTNDFMFDTATWAAWKANADLLVASIRTWDADIPIILIGGPSPGPDSYWGSSSLTPVVNRADFQRRQIDFSRNLYADYDTAAARTNNIYVSSFLGTVSDVNMNDPLHPNDPLGHNQMGPWLAGVLNNLVIAGKA